MSITITTNITENNIMEKNITVNIIMSIMKRLLSKTKKLKDRNTSIIMVSITIGDTSGK